MNSISNIINNNNNNNDTNIDDTIECIGQRYNVIV